jgi:preprotein translocase subunit SecD
VCSRRCSRPAQIQADFVQFDGNSVKARLQDTDTQIKAKDAIAKALNPDPADPRYIVALNLLSRTPTWMARMRALPMYLGLDLRGGVHFLMQVDMKSALTKKAEDPDRRHAHAAARQEHPPRRHHARWQLSIEVRFRDAAT